MGKLIAFIPNFITLLNAFCGALAVLFFANNELLIGSYFILLGALFDFFDGLVARALNVSSLIGKDLDSLADMLTFGFAPAYLAHKLLLISLGVFSEDFKADLYLQYIPFIAVPFTAYRLAKFNNDTRQSFCFYGLASPAHALFWISIPLMIHFSDENYFFHWFFDFFQFDIRSTVFHPELIISCSIIFSLLMVLDIPLFAMKFESLAWKGNELKFAFIFLSVFLLIFIGFAAVPVVLFLYILMSLAHYKLLGRD